MAGTSFLTHVWEDETFRSGYRVLNQLWSVGHTGQQLCSREQEEASLDIFQHTDMPRTLSQLDMDF